MTPISALLSPIPSSLQSLPLGGLILVDGSISDLDGLLQLLRGCGEIVVLDPQQEPRQQLQTLLQGRDGRLSLHLIGGSGGGGVLPLADPAEALTQLALPSAASLLTYSWDGVSLTAAASASPAAPSARELVVVDGGLADLPLLLEDLARQGLTRTVLVLDPAADPTAQLIAALNGDTTAYDAIHLISHGSTGRLRLGGQQLDLADPASHSDLWAAINSSLTPEGDLLLYGCNVAASEDARRSLELIAGLTAADVAASSDLTGKGGDWTLESSVGSVQTEALSLQNWQGTLACPPPGQTEAFFKSRHIVANFHGAFYRAEDGGYFISGEYAAPNGVDANLSPVLVAPSADAAKNYNYTGTLIDVAAGGNCQYAIATTEGLWVWGDTDYLVSKDLTTANGSAFQKISLPGGLDPAKIKFLSGADNGMAIVMQDGTVWVNVTRFGSGWAQGNGDANDSPSDTSQFQQVLTAAATPLTGITHLEFCTAGGFAYNETTRKFYSWGEYYFAGNGANPTSEAYAKEVTSPLATGVSVVQLGLTSQFVDNGERDVPERTYFVLGSDGRIYTMGQNGDGEAGQGAVGQVKTWTTVKNKAGTAPLENVEFISANNMYSGGGYQCVLAVLKDGTALTWGEDDSDMIALAGDNSYLPADPTWLDPQGARPVYAGEVGGHLSMLILRDASGQITATGHNQGGGFGDGTTTDKAGYTTTQYLGTENGGLAYGGCDESGGGGGGGFINNVTVNEASPYAIFSINAAAGEELNLSLVSGTARIGLDTSSSLQYWDPTAEEGAGAWIDYTGPFLVPEGIGEEETPLLVRVAIRQDPHFERSESFKLEAFYTGAETPAFGIGTILDDGTGDLYGPDNTDGLPDEPGENGLPGDLIRDDDRPLEVKGSIVNENSPYLTWTVSGEQGQPLSLSLSSGSALYGTDTGTQLEVFDGSDWVAYVPGSTIVIPGSDLGAAGDLQLRLPVRQDALSELSESLLLTARNASGGAFSAEGTILDQGGLSIDPAATPLAVNDLTVNETSPYAIFTVSGVEGQPLTLALSSGTATLGTDTGTQLQVFNGTNWVNYTPGSTVTIPSDGNPPSGEPAVLLVRIAIKNDTPAEGPETFTLTATSGGLSTTGTCTILDDGTGQFYGTENTDGQPDTAGQNGLDPDLVPDNDLANNPAVSDVEVNEASPFVVFRVQGVPGAGIDLWLQDLSAEPADRGNAIEVFDPELDDWVPYDPDTTVIPEDGVLLARVAINNDLPFEGPEQFKLNAAYNDNGVTEGVNVGGSDSGTATILDDGTGQLFLTREDDPETPEDETDPGVNDFNEPELDRFSPLNDDRDLSIDDVTVNEASPYAIFRVTAVEGQELLLDLASGNATIGQDTGTLLQYYNGSSWVDVVPGTPISVPGDGDGTGNEAVPLLVRVAIVQDVHYETPESFQLIATYPSSGKQATGTGTILDDGSGNLYGPANTDGQPDLPGENGLPGDLIKDDDRPLEVKGSTVNESSPYVTWTVSGEQGQPITLSLGGGSATVGTDTGTQLQIFDGLNWVDYTPGSAVTIPGSDSGAPGDLQVRLAVKQDNAAELAETLDLIAANISGQEFSGTSTILDQGGVVVDPLAKPLTVNDVRVNEGSPYAVFTVGGVEGQPLTLALASVSALIGTDTGTQLQIFDGSNWVNYTPGSTVTIPDNGNGTPGEPASLLVRVAITNDNPAEGPETFTLTATSGGLSTVGVGTIVDDGTGDLFGPGNKDGQPDQPGENGLPLNLLKDNDLGRNPAVTDVSVNEASPFVVFTVLGVPGAGVTLTLIDGSAEPDDHGPGIEVFDPALDAWVPYDPATTVMPEDGKLLARVAINNDAPFEGPETVALEATYNNKGVTEGITVGGKDAGTATIKDDGTGTLFLTRPDDPSTPQDESNLGVNDLGEPELDRFSPLNDDRRPLSIADVEVNEASPYAVFTVVAVEGQALLLDLASGNATIGQDTGTLLQFFDGTNWVDVVPGTPIVVPGDGDATTTETVSLLVRVAIVQDVHFESPESFTLTATDALTGSKATGTGTILDDGRGDLFGPDNRDGQPDLPGEKGLPVDLVKDDDRPLEVSGTTVNESSPYVSWTVSGEQGQPIKLSLGAGSATVGTDTGTQLQIFDGRNWVDYTPGSTVIIPGSDAGAPGDLQVRLAVKPDNAAELAETLDLIAANISGQEFTGTSTILDEGGLVIDPLARPLTVNDVTVNEGSPYAVFRVGGVEGQQLSLELASVSALIGTDTGTQLQVFNGTTWVNYTPGSIISIPSNGDALPGEPATLLVRIAITNDNPAEGPETFTLTATSGGLSTVGVGTIVDDGTGDLFGPTNKDGQPDQPGENGLPLNLIKDNDLGRNPAVSDVSVNEASPFVVFTVQGVPGAGVTLTLIDGTAEPTDHGPGIEVFDPALDAWVAYDPATTVMPEDGKLLARVAINNDAPFEGPETFALEATYNANGITNGITVGGKDAGTATIKDDGTGTIFLTNVDDPNTPEDESNLGVNDRGEPEFNRSAPLDDDRTLSVSDVSVNEASPYALFTVTAVEGQALLLDLASGNATIGQDTGTLLQYFDGTNWVDVVPGTPIVVPGDGDGTSNELLPFLVRVAIRQDDTPEDAEDFVLTATYASNGQQASGTGTILDDGTGNLYGPDNTDGQPDLPGENGLPLDLVLDDDRRAPRLIATADGRGLQLIGLPDQQLWVDLSAVLADASLQNGYDLVRVAVDGERSPIGAIGATPDSEFFGDVRFLMAVGEQLRFIQRSGAQPANSQPDVSISGEGNCLLIGLDDNGGDGDANDLLLKVKTSRYDPYPISTQMARYQESAELAYLDLSWIDAEGISLAVDVQSDCGQRNSIRLVRVDVDADGKPLGTVGGLAPTAGPAFDQAVRANLLSYSYQQSGTQTLEAPPVVVAGSDAGVYAPVLITEAGTVYTFGSRSSSDGRQHVKVLGANSFAFEDASGASADNDFNDVVVSFQAVDPLSPTLVLGADGRSLEVVAGSGQAGGLWLDLRALEANAKRQNSFDLVCEAADGSRRQIGSIGATSRGTFFGSKEVFIGIGESLHFVQNSNADLIDESPALQITKVGERYRIALNDNGNSAASSSGDEDYNDLVIDVDRSPLQPCEEVVKLASRQLSDSDGILDLTDLDAGGARLELAMLTDSGDTNTLSFVKLGTDPLTGEYTVGGKRASEGEAFREAVRDNLVDFEASLGGAGATATRIWQLNQNESGLYAAVLIGADGTLHTIGESSGVDGRQHLKVLGDSSFGFEDGLASRGADFDYNDFVVRITAV